jgi:hypothetical protein
MKRLLLLLLFALVGSFVFSQAKMTSAEYYQQNPELFSVAPTDQPSVPPVTTGNEEKKLLNGATYTYVGYFNGLSGPDWQTNPPCYTGQEAAALLFGGVPSDYAISTNPNTTDPNTITFTAWMVTIYVPGWAEYPQNYKVDLPPPGYRDPAVYAGATSAYVWDNPPPPGNSINYVWRVETATVPLSGWAIGIGILLIVSLAVIRIRRY